MAIDKIIIAEVADNTNWNSFMPYYAHTWCVSTINDYTNFYAPEFEAENIGLEIDLNVLSFSENKIQYRRVDTEGEAIAIEGSFHFDNDTKFLLVHFRLNKNPFDFELHELEIGFTLGFYKSSSDVVPEWNDQQYYNRLLSAPDIQQKKDNIYLSKQIYSNGRIVIDNNDYRFIDFDSGYNAKRKAGNYIRILQFDGVIPDSKEVAYSEFEIIHQGLVSETKESSTLSIKYDDLRTQFNDKILKNTIDNNNFPYIKSPDKEYLKQQTWGKCYEVPCLCLNENENKGLTSSFKDYKFLLSDSSLRGYSTFDDDRIRVTIATDAIILCYIDGIEIDFIPDVLLDETNEIYYFIIPYSYFIDDNDKFKGQNKMSVTCNGYLDDSLNLISNGMHVMRELLYQAYYYTYSATYYDLATWASYENNSDFTYNIGLLLKKPKQLSKILEEISNSLLGSFIWEADLKFSFDNDDFDTLQADIPKNEFFPFAYIPEIESDSKTVLAAFRVGVRQKWDTTKKEDQFEYITDSTNSVNALSEFNSKAEKDFLTLLYDETDIEKYKERIHYFADIPDDRINVKLPWKYKETNKGEYFAIEYDLPEQYFKGWLLCQVQSISLSPEDYSVNIEFRVFRYGYYLALADENNDAILDRTGNKILVLQE